MRWLDSESISQGEFNTANAESTVRHPLSSMKENILFFVKGFCLVGFLFLFSQFEGTLPVAVIAIAWAVLSSLSSIGLTYHVVIRKIHKQVMLIDGGIPGMVNEGRFLSLLVSFVLSAVLVAGLMFEAPKWTMFEWSALLASVPFFFIAMYGARWFSKKSYEPLYQRSKEVLVCSGIVCAVLCIIYLVFSIVQAPETYPSAAEAYLAASNPFDQSPSIILLDAGMINAFIDGSISYALSQVAESSIAGYVLLKVLVGVSAFLGFASLLGTCSISEIELRRVFQPLAAAKNAEADQAFVPKYIAFACVFPLILAVAFPICDMAATRASETEEYSAVELFVRDKMGVAAYFLDGKYYDRQAVDGLLAEARKKSQGISSEAAEKLTPLINEAYDKRIENVDAYLDWYYSLPADYDRLIQFFAGSIEEGMANQLNEKINAGIEDSELSDLYDAYIQQADDLKNDIETKLAEHELRDIPAFLIVDEIDLSPDFLEEPMSPTEQLLETRQRFGIDTAAGIGSGLVAKSVTERILSKPVFEEITNKLIAKLGRSGFVKLATSAAGTAIAPGVGTAAGIGVGFLSDYLFLKADEALNRDTYRQELIDAIEQDRKEKLEIMQTLG